MHEGGLHGGGFWWEYDLEFQGVFAGKVNKMVGEFWMLVGLSWKSGVDQKNLLTQRTFGLRGWFVGG